MPGAGTGMKIRNILLLTNHNIMGGWKNVSLLASPKGACVCVDVFVCIHIFFFLSN